ncbi:MAG: DegT/DnrJ/EryC1/StrS family aminotransferase [Bacteroidia bacterium]|nr:DegT/DnrJ/EryC1/StrS family aminotransferase [Bacteroidia bacterium]HQZ25859.1 DegT/DnrJ/EryC1/StrS family aminotransferase [Flavobacterium sp.]MBP7715523.1 DegT/DnrJ/EryC1/StrS family aminotransferase [Bacteroidia bacterium]MBP8668664.1 DegT/DnrJ/EryC1/StrS family aminotransferase [Bacteroidia bacterium]HOZ82079.1 DegT/DnrJ/EryC1/StrS family aminotransferase [Bacteroidia bacterium]
MKVPFAPPRMDQRVIDEVADTLLSGWITTGPKTKKFEKLLTAYCNVPNVLALNSATAGLEIMLRWFGVKEGDEVILPAYTYSATANVVIHCGAKPVFVDVGDDFNILPSEIENAINKNTKVIMPVDFGGLPCDFQKVNNIFQSENIKNKFVPATDVQQQLGRILVLSDAAHSFGATVNNIKTGALTDVSVFSFHAVKNLTTGEGGAIALNLPKPFDNQSIYDYLCIYTLHGQNKDALAKMQKGNWRYDIIEAGFKCNMTDIMASIGLVELERYAETLERRKQIVANYNEAFAKYPWAQLPEFKSNWRESSYHLYPIRIKNCTEKQRDAIMQKMFDADIAVNVHFIPVPMFSFYTKLGYSLQHYPKAKDNYEREISLPLFYNLTEEQQQYVIDNLIKAVNETLVHRPAINS